MENGTKTTRDHAAKGVGVSQTEGAKARGTVADPNVPSKEPPRRSSTVTFLSGTVFEETAIEKDGGGATPGDADPPNAPALDGVPGSVKLLAAQMGPKKGALKAFNKGSLQLNRKELRNMASSSFDQSDRAKDEFFRACGFTEVIRREVLSHCANIYHMTVLLDNSPGMAKENDALKNTKAEDRKALALYVPDKLWAEDSDIHSDPSRGVSPLYEEMQGTSNFLLKLAVTLAFPISFEIFKHSGKRGGRGGGFRSVLASEPPDEKARAEDYIPHREQVESALEMIDGFASFIEPLSPGSCEEPIRGMKRYYDDERPRIEREGKRAVAVVITSQYPWGRRGGERDLGDFRDGFVGLLKQFADVPVTLVFVVKSREERILQFYDWLASPESGVKAEVRIAKGLGAMIDGVSRHNPWLNYCLPVHLCQDLGVGGGVLPRLAARPLDAAESRELCLRLVGDVPDPGADVEGFLDGVERLMSDPDHVRWSPVSGEDSPLVDVAKLRRHLRKSPTYTDFLVALLICVLAIAIGCFGRHVKLAG